MYLMTLVWALVCLINLNEAIAGPERGNNNVEITYKAGENIENISVLLQPNDDDAGWNYKPISNLASSGIYSYQDLNKMSNGIMTPSSNEDGKNNDPALKNEARGNSEKIPSRIMIPFILEEARLRSKRSEKVKKENDEPESTTNFRRDSTAYLNRHRLRPRVENNWGDIIARWLSKFSNWFCDNWCTKPQKYLLDGILDPDLVDDLLNHLASGKNITELKLKWPNVQIN